MLLNALNDVGACKLAFHEAAETVQSIISESHTSLATVNATNKISSLHAGTAIHFVDCRFFFRGGCQKNRHKSKTKNVFYAEGPDVG